MLGRTMRRTPRKNITQRSKKEHYIEMQRGTLYGDTRKNIT
jgi:hypothetical protein